MKVKSKKLKVKNMNFIKQAIFAFCLFSFAFTLTQAQEQPPEPTTPRAVKVPVISESKLPNGLRVVVVERKNVPLVSVNLLVDSGAMLDAENLDGTANMVGDLLTKGTKTRKAEAISEQMEFLGSSIQSTTNWMVTNVGFSATTDKVDKAAAILSDVILNPTFPQSEIDLYKSQLIDELNVDLKQPGTLGRFVAARYTFGEHPVQGTPETIKAITRKDLLAVYKANYYPNMSTLIFTGDITLAQAKLLAKKYFGLWKMPPPPKTVTEVNALPARTKSKETQIVKRFLVIDLPNSGQASVTYSKQIEGEGKVVCPKPENCHSGETYFSANVLNSLLGGGYSSRMNQEIRIKRGLSYGAGSSIAWRWNDANFITRCQTKTVSAAEVAELTVKEIDRLVNDTASGSELNPRKNVLNGDFGRTFETNSSISGQIADLLTFSLPYSELNSFMNNVEKVSPQQVKEFAANNLRGGDIIIVGDYNDFKADLAKRFPNQKIEVIKADDLDLNSDTLRKK